MTRAAGRFDPTRFRILLLSTGGGAADWASRNTKGTRSATSWLNYSSLIHWVTSSISYSLPIRRLMQLRRRNSR